MKFCAITVLDSHATEHVYMCVCVCETTMTSYSVATVLDVDEKEERRKLAMLMEKKYKLFQKIQKFEFLNFLKSKTANRVYCSDVM